MLINTTKGLNMWTQFIKMAYRHSVCSALPSAQAFCDDPVTSPIFHRWSTPNLLRNLLFSLRNAELYLNEYFSFNLSTLYCKYSLISASNELATTFLVRLDTSGLKILPDRS